MDTITIKHEAGICHVPLFGFTNKAAVLLEDDLEELLALGVEFPWKFYNGNVWTPSN